MQLRGLLSVFFLTFVLSGASAFGAVATIAVASNFAEVAKHLASEFESNSGHRLTIVTGASGRFYAQILNGAPFDVFLSADSEKPSQLISSGYGQPDSAFTYATGRLVLWSRDESLIKDDASVLSSIDSYKVAYANPRLAPYGKAALEVMEALSLFESLERNLVQGENISQVYQFVFTGNAELGFVAQSQIPHNGDLGIGSSWVIPAALHSPIKQDAVLLSRAKDNVAAREFMSFLSLPSSQAVIRSYGYESGVSAR